MPTPDAKPNGKDTMPINIQAAPFNMEPVIAANQRGLQAAAEAQTRMMRSLMQINQDMFDFMNCRIKRYHETANEIAACKSPQEAASVCTLFAQTAMKDYSEGFGGLVGSYVEQTQDALQDVQHQVEKPIEATSPKGA